MKNLYLLTTTVLLLATACKKENIAKQSEYDASYKTWLSYKSGIQNSYTYTTSFGSWTGFGTTTTVTVTKGKIIARDFVSFKYHQDGTNNIDTIKKWHEDVASINTHPSDAAVALTIDDIYLKARTEWLKADATSNDIIFEAKNNGLISSCGYVPRNCTDDCFNGIRITVITKM